jgi:hypothetical protein
VAYLAMAALSALAIVVAWPRKNLAPAIAEEAVS